MEWRMQKIVVVDLEEIFEQRPSSDKERYHVDIVERSSRATTKSTRQEYTS